ncbi:MAG TPA: putative quinol monooxygenase [Steroidobacteraceae bacterium]|nr:putative quinol monooxygenase [Steroidobacteraceae bacterium]
MRIGLISAALTLCLLGAAHAQTPAGGSAAAGPEPTTFVVRFKIKSGRNAEFEKVMHKLQGQLRHSEPGNVYYDLYRPLADAQTYVLIEHYKDAEAVKAHGQDPHTKEMAAAIRDLIDGPPEAERLVLVSSKR